MGSNLGETQMDVKSYFRSGRACARRSADHLYIESDKKNIAVFDNIILALDAQFSRALYFFLATQRKQIGAFDHLRTDETSRHVAMDFSRGFHRMGATPDKRLTDFV